jgi:hypothetical protein
VDRDRDGMQAPRQWTTDVHPEVDELLRSQLEHRGEPESCETRFQLRVPVESRTERYCSTSAALGWDRCAWRSYGSFRAYTWGSVIAANLVMLARYSLS